MVDYNVNKFSITSCSCVNKWVIFFQMGNMSIN